MLLGRVPVPPLSAFVDVLWYASDWKPAHDRERHMPDGAVNLIVQLGAHERVTSANLAIVSGPRSQASVLDTSRPDTVIGAHFTKGGAARLLDMPVSEICNTNVALADVGGLSARFLRERLLALPSPDARLDLLEGWLMRRLLGRPDRDPAIAWAVRQFERHPPVRVAEVSAHIGRSSRWFIARFAAEVGLTPKVFSRLQRFQSALRHGHGRAGVSLADLAAWSGYFDQAHFSHDFRSFAGITPTAYLRGRTEFHNHVAVSD